MVDAASTMLAACMDAGHVLDHAPQTEGEAGQPPLPQTNSLQLYRSSHQAPLMSCTQLAHFRTVRSATRRTHFIVDKQASIDEIGSSDLSPTGIIRVDGLLPTPDRAAAESGVDA